jgi:5,10-methylene-tetrahydrofolate dehydrogenase/methenyl tetrahydrofolate cyclohydrolase
MSKDNVLKKQFQEKDVQRLRNLVQGKHADKSQISVGFAKGQEIHHKEGDTWVEGDKTWTIRDGIKQNVTKLDAAKAAVNLPIFCPSCKKVMKPHLDKKWYNMYKRCFNCQIDFEYEIRSQGLWEEYETILHNSDLEGIIQEFQIWIDEEIQHNNIQSYITEAGDVEKWTGSVKNKLLESKEETIKYLQSLKK